MFYHYASTVCFVNNHNLYSGLVLPSLLETEFNYNKHFSWSVSQSDLASMPAKGVISGGDVTSGQVEPHQIMLTKGKTGHVDVTASLKTSGSFLIGGFGSISDTLSIRLVNDAVVMPDQVEILFLME